MAHKVSKTIHDLKHYKYLSCIITNKTSVVYKAQHKKTKQIVAIKIYENTPLFYQQEIAALNKLQHKNIIHMIEHWTGDIYYYIVLEYVPNADLLEYILKLKDQKILFIEAEVRFIFKQILEAVLYMHEHKICHRDLKPSNILIGEGGQHFIVADFGFARDFSDGQLVIKSCGTIDYASPEICCGKPYFGPEIDVWSLGVILYTLTVFSEPFYGYNNKDIAHKICRGLKIFPKDFSVQLKDLLGKMLNVNAKYRIKVEEICRHPWITVEDDEVVLCP